jgi:two-component system phosphate regulon sensor histidine kinase PhoR
VKDFIQRNLISSAAFVISVTLTLVFSILELVWFGNFNFSKSAISLLILFVVAYIMIGYVVNQFIYEKVKLIYKTIRNLKTTKSEIKSMLREDRGALETVNQDVISWAEIS